MKKIIISILAIFSILYACKEDDFVLPQPESKMIANGENKIFNKANPSEDYTKATGDESINLVVELNSEVSINTPITIANESQTEKIVEKFKKFKNTKDYQILPTDYYEISEGTLTAGTKSTELQVDIKSYADLPQGNYVLPIQIDVDGKSLNHIILISKDAEYVALSDQNPKPMPSGEYSCPDRKKPMKMVAYVETNDFDIRNMGQFLLSESNQPVFDMVVLFAANMNYDAATGKRHIFFNDKLKPLVDNPEIYFKPLQDRGIKVIIDILPNHQGVGYENFQSYDEALEFAKELKRVTDKIGIDGWDIDEEYADYFKQPGLRKKGSTSYMWYIKAMKEVMPDKLLTLYDYGHRIGFKAHTDDGKNVTELIDYTWSDYGVSGASGIGVEPARYGARSIEANHSLNPRWVQRAAQYNLEKCNGIQMIFNIKGEAIRSGSAQKALSAATQLFYGQSCKFVGKYHKGPKDFK
ncbi:BT_3987 domain-containing protein [Ornithobacterium rhinotracheale]